jgi:nitrogen fixation-related uncharacterized protein
MWAGFLIAIILLLIFLWSKASEDLHDEQRENKSLIDQNQHLKEARDDYCNELYKLKKAQENDLKAAITYAVSHSRTKENKTELIDIIVCNLDYVGKINNVTDFFEYDIKYIIKICLYANKGYLDVYHNYTEEDERPFVILENEKKVYITKSVEQDMYNNRYDFVLGILEAKK